MADANCYCQVNAAITLAKKSDKPTLIVCHTKIGFGSPKEGMASSHGEPLGEENLAATKKNLGWPCTEHFGVTAEVYDCLLYTSRDCRGTEPVPL